MGSVCDASLVSSESHAQRALANTTMTAMTELPEPETAPARPAGTASVQTAICFTGVRFVTIPAQRPANPGELATMESLALVSASDVWPISTERSARIVFTDSTEKSAIFLAPIPV